MSNRTIKVILQARLNSSRLPAKMLLPIGDLPLVVLCAKRAGMSGLDVVVATSEEETDDLMVQALGQHGISFIRGSLDNVLDRFISATQSLKDDDLVVRLTGDNPFVDADFIQDLITFHDSHNEHYSRTLSPQDGWPYGLSAEIISAGALRAIAISNPSDMDKEHVTLKPTAQGTYALYTNPCANDLSHLRVTVDTFEDYLRAAQVFDIADNWAAPWPQLLDILQNLQDTPKMRVPYKLRGYKTQSQMALGTVQLGLPYGIANTTGQPNKTVAHSILNEAINHGVNLIDTASAYGVSESLIGELLTTAQKQDILITTKLTPLTDCETDRDDLIVEKVKNSVLQSLHRLQITKIPVLMLHRWAHYHYRDNLVLKTLLQLQKDGLIQKIGASVQAVEEGIAALRAEEIDFVQLPFNILDKRWKDSGFIKERARSPEKHIQARSVFLQGLLCMPPKEWDEQHGAARTAVADFLSYCLTSFNRSSQLDLCMGFVKSQPWIDSLVIGVEAVSQLHDNINLMGQMDFSADDLAKIEDAIPSLPDTLLNPAQWRHST